MKCKFIKYLIFVFAVIFFIQGTSFAAQAQKQDLSEIEKAFPSYKKIPGLFTFYYKKSTGKFLMQIKKDQLEKVFICSVTRTASEDENSPQYHTGCYAFVFSKVGDKVYFNKKNVDIRAQNDKFLQKAVEKSVSDFVAGVAEIKIEDSKNGDILIDAAKLFINEDAILAANSYEKPPKISVSESYFYKVKSFPENSEIESALVDDKKRTITRYNFSLYYNNNKDYKERVQDDRINYFSILYKDYSDVSKETPYVEHIQRWHLQKQDPAAQISPPKKPIVFWIENTVPRKYRNAIKDGILFWNRAFEKTGYKDVLIVKEQPDNADWESEDIRYNTICLMVTPGESANARGPSYEDPFTGEILGADVVFSADMLREFYYAAEILQIVGILSEAEKEKFVTDGLRYIAGHELGHSLGLLHNFKGSALITKEGAVGSIMDYYPLDVINFGRLNGSYWPADIGLTDYIGIEYGYVDTGAKTPEEEKSALDKIASKMISLRLPYGTDVDADNEVNTDPLCNRYDLGDDVINYNRQNMLFSKRLWDALPAYFEKHPDKSCADIRKFFKYGYLSYSRAARMLPKYIGGVNHVRYHIKDLKYGFPVEPVPAEKQREALRFIIKSLFAKDAFYFSPKMINMMPPNRIGPDDYEGDLTVVQTVSNFQKTALDELYKNSKLKSVLNNQLRYSGKMFTLDEMFVTVRNGIWSELDGVENINIYRRNLQAEHVSKLMELISPNLLALIKSEGKSKVPSDAVAFARRDLKIINGKIEKILSTPNNKLESYTMAHLEEIRDTITKFLKGDIFSI